MSLWFLGSGGEKADEIPEKRRLVMKLDANKKILIVVALVLYLLYKMMGG